ncbi:hypothetical protein AMS68_005852 [Peltaster fructicola]|uniref:Glutamate decarboxylase n=1 Tax=Peltaster fructicola TaxID=286661 RepID=A0A6H0Y096_9PEZI|nr:hypothetical protein AMS68_005852 [Peltaster fructicola]
MSGAPTTSEVQPVKLNRASEVEELLKDVQELIVPFIRAADEDAAIKHTGHGLQQTGQGPRTTLVEYHPPNKLQSLLDFNLPRQGQGKQGLLEAIRKVLKYSVNTWDQGFLDKLYASITPVGLAAELVLATLNTNAHVYQVAPALISIEKQTGKALAELFGLKDAYSGGVSQPGGSAANLSSVVIARNNLHPETKEEGYGDKKFVLFTSEHGHYSLEKAAQILGFGSKAVRSIAVDKHGRMRADALDHAIVQAKSNGETPFYVNATAGTTVLGSFDPLIEISAVCREHSLWLHVDGSWGGPVIFSKAQACKLQGSEMADSIALCPHKMLNVPVTCSYLLGKDLRQFHKAMTLPAGYLFHNEEDVKEIWDLADLTPQCGRRGDSLKLALSWVYYGTEGFGSYIDHAFEVAAYLVSLIQGAELLTLVSEDSPLINQQCLQVCFYLNKHAEAEQNSKTTETVARLLVPRGFMVDFAPGVDGKFFRVVINGQTTRSTVEGLVKAIQNIGSQQHAG